MKKNTSTSIPLYITFLFVTCLVILTGNAYNAYQNLEKLKTNNDWVEHTWSVKDKLKDINLLIMDSESSLRGYFMSGNEIYLRPWDIAKSKLEDDFKELEKRELPDLNFSNTRLSPKSIIYPQSEIMFKYSLDEKDPDHHIMKDAGKDYSPKAVLGIRP